MIVGAVGIAVCSSLESRISTDEKIAILLGLVMIVFGFIIMYGDRGKSKNNNHNSKSGE